ncbi:fungal protein [Schizosaccharomyces japonicus yFS275]|uniref:Fungal protein n=1 Tax=Schizosaccharomyces japonicus (strain yFS275 / FY16936) TaxID=402676 RepID=B6K205_SCHJY|nr:fungal protein [Schizosaccharomyces japonicus yFS275]EEB07186.1 fungal protein [Schizosaccharomyces japonicus yFS275]
MTDVSTREDSVQAPDAQLPREETRETEEAMEKSVDELGADETGLSTENELMETAGDSDFDDTFDDFGAFETQLPVCTFENDWEADLDVGLDTIFGAPTALKEIDASCLIHDRIASLWGKLIEMPVLQRPDWAHSNIRRLFLINMGLPVNLDELIPASHKTSRQRPGVVRLSTVQPTPLENEPVLDLVQARRLCAVTPEALANRSLEALKQHMAILEETLTTAESLAQFWIDKKDSAVNEKQLYEAVVDDLVHHSKRQRSIDR